MVEVVAAVMMRDGKILIGQRKRGGRHPLKWEFPGGKVEPGKIRGRRWRASCARN